MRKVIFDSEEGRPAEGCTVEPVTQRIWFSVGMFIGTSGVVRAGRRVWGRGYAGEIGPELTGIELTQ